jgi:XTP/dITP diphosphohydrolase
VRLPGSIVIATGNPHKVEELRDILGGVRIPFVGLNDLPGHDGFAEPREHGSTFEENAAIKALSYARQTGRICLADDSGLEVDALGGRPGVISSHYSTDGAETGLSRAQRDAANNERLLRELEGIPEERRTARFVCVMALASPLPAISSSTGVPPVSPSSTPPGGEVLATSRGTFEGRIGLPGEVPRGHHGFGYDPLFIIEDGRTSAELPPEEKNRRSHRAAAARAMLEQFPRLFGAAASPEC